MSSSTSGDNSRMQVISQAFKSGSWAGCGLIVPWMRIPSWALIVCVLFAVACGTLRASCPRSRLIAWSGGHRCYTATRHRQIQGRRTSDD